MDVTGVDRLIVQNLSDLDAAAKRIAEIEHRVWSEMAEVVSTWASGKGWDGHFEDDRVWTAPPGWLVDDESEAWFEFSCGPDDTGEGKGEEPSFWLSRYAGVNGGRLCLWLERTGIAARAWRLNVREAAGKLAKFGVLLDDKAQPYLDCTLKQSELAAGLENDDLSGALEPVRRALNQAAKATPLLGQLLSKARKG